MKKTNYVVNLLVMILLCTINNVHAQYKETMNPKGLSKNLKKDYGLVDDNAATNQSEKLTKAIDFIHKKGGGRIIIPKGTYNLSGIKLKSNVHILIDAGTVIKPKGNSVFTFDTKTGKGQGYIENTSVRGVGGKFIVDYHTLLYKDKQRAIVARMVKNFMIENMIVKDNYSTHCGIIFTLTKTMEDISKWEVSRPTDGILRNICHFRANPGYGLVQCHGAQSIHFENLYSLGGVTLRLEVGADLLHVGVYDLTAKNIINENGRMAVLMGPHSAKSGVVTIDGVTTISSTYAIGMSDGHVKKNAPDQTPGYFDNKSSIKNVHAIFGTNAQSRSDQSLLSLPNNNYYDSFRAWRAENGKFFDGPSISAVSKRNETYNVTLTNVTTEGFPYFKDKPILTPADVRKGKGWDEKKSWLAKHQGDKWLSDKGGIIEDYSVESCIDKNPY
ncbi:hypothetical protein [Flavicella sediminum]|uniref:hypothetical protein n=1 Tax=Flavicella sediminum TaxID=2585141 RepID=UPI0011207B59|nr:hypothetical protein [Flavicella sediminum]